jgi:hypothetical protein
MHETHERVVSAIAPPAEALAYDTVTFDAVRPDAEYVRRAVGIDPQRPAHRRWLSVVDEYIDTLPRLMRPRGVYRIDAVRQLEQRRLELASGAVYHGDIRQYFDGAAYVATLVVTVGGALERLARRWMKGTQIMRGAIVDAVASEATEVTAERMRTVIRAWAQARELGVSTRYSPGYCGMHVREQQTLFASLPTHTIRVRLTASSLMMPIKSVSGLVGIGPAARLPADVVACATCDHPHCTQRRVPFGHGQGTSVTAPLAAPVES